MLLRNVALLLTIKVLNRRAYVAEQYISSARIFRNIPRVFSGEIVMDHLSGFFLDHLVRFLIKNSNEPIAFDALGLVKLIRGKVGGLN